MPQEGTTQIRMATNATRSAPRTVLHRVQVVADVVGQVGSAQMTPEILDRSARIAARWLSYLFKSRALALRRPHTLYRQGDVIAFRLDLDLRIAGGHVGEA